MFRNTGWFKMAVTLQTRARCRGHRTPFRQEVHWLWKDFDTQFQVLAVTYQALYNLVEGNLDENVLLYKATWSLRFARQIPLIAPPPLENHLIVSRKRTFFVALSRLWNSLPRDITFQPPTPAIFLTADQGISLG